MTRAKFIGWSVSISAAILLIASPSWSQDKPDPGITLAEGKIVLKAPKEWVRKPPRSKIVDHEFETPAADGDKLPGRLTAMGAGGSVKDNIDRWIGQFAQSDGKPTKDKALVEKLKVAGQEVHYVDVSGDYKDSPAGPFAGGQTVVRENYRMLGAIIITDKGNYFLKYYGPKKTVDANEKLFKDVVNSLEVK